MVEKAKTSLFIAKRPSCHKKKETKSIPPQTEDPAIAKQEEKKQ